MEQEQLSAELNSAAKPQKVTRYQLEQSQILSPQEKAQREEEERLRRARIVKMDELEENTNRQSEDAMVSASSLDEALSQFGITQEEEDEHPERRMKAAFRAFEEREFPRIKKDNPSLKFSQWKQLLWGEWQKSPENPVLRAKMRAAAAAAAAESKQQQRE